MRINNILAGSHVNGPGTRTVIHVQGCTLGCAGCWNPQTWDASGGKEYMPFEVAGMVVDDAAPGTTGITVSGGEPFQQAISLYSFIFHIKNMRPDWSIGVFTGYSVSELNTGDYSIMEGPVDRYNYSTRRLFSRNEWNAIREMLDFAICGRYDRTKPIDPASDTLLDRPDIMLVTSANQSVELLSSRYTYADFPPLQVEVTIDKTGLTQISGFPL